ncbi:PolA DNA polymerase I - 3'-5' exonuclease and polymerase domains [uncultured Caudovirales phage]|uniref:DNA polymerase n=1 Tax=uncultured Caudovirales phage TaxID=2100421 RepID=A0A6J5KQ85_9CAUD|nr:PolA DNA polymerase I - 3'-5' exonuclease and polymerase domains [uncultured Caudovirales phage]
MRLVFDLEANGLLNDASRIHCLVAKDLDTGDLHKFAPSEVEQGLKLLMQADQVIGHNVIGYDLELVSKLHPWCIIPRERVVDTLILSRLLYTDLSDRDQKARVQMEGKLTGSHSLKAWGIRLGIHKGDYDGGWETFSEDMLEYNVQDVVVTERLHEKLSQHEALTKTANDLEHEVAHIIAKQVRTGFSFDEKGAMELTARLQIRRVELEQKLQDTFKPWTESEEFIPKVNNKARGYVKGEPTFKHKTIVFNPGSRAHIADRLKTIHGWVPKEFTPDGRPKVDETVLGGLKYPEAQLLTEYLLVQKRLGMVSEGQGSWLKSSRQGRIHGDLITNGAVTGRATHRSPNIAQVPAVGALYGKECRSLFGPSKGKVLVGIDVSGLELRMLGNFMSFFDNGAYAKDVIDGDIHTVNQQAAGLDTRNQAKTFIYAFLYGAGAEKIGSIVGKGATHGNVLKKRFLAQTPALAKLIRAVQSAADRGYLIGLDGRRLHIRSSHAALNTLLQSAGALVCKQWMVEVDRMLTQQEWSHKVQQIAWVHDEIQCECDPEIADEFGKKTIECIVKAGEFFKIKVPLTGEYKIGNNWAETH